MVHPLPARPVNSLPPDPVAPRSNNGHTNNTGLQQLPQRPFVPNFGTNSNAPLNFQVTAPQGPNGTPTRNNPSLSSNRPGFHVPGYKHRRNRGTVASQVTANINQQRLSHLPPKPAVSTNQDPTRQQAKRVQKFRMKRLYNSVVGTGRVKRTFPGKIIIDDRADALDHSIQREGPKSGHEWTYWTDGSVRSGSSNNHSFMGAGVTCLKPDRSGFKKIGYPIGRNCGDTNDAELHAISEALKLALEDIHEKRDAKVIMYTDSQNALMCLNNGNPILIGPVVSSRLVLAEAYERAEALHEAGANLELRWVPGHSTSKGNDAADTAAYAASSCFQDLQKLIGPTELTLLRENMQGASKDIREEYLYRASLMSSRPVRFLLGSNPTKEVTQAGVADWLKNGGDISALPTKEHEYEGELLEVTDQEKHSAGSSEILDNWEDLWGLNNKYDPGPPGVGNDNFHPYNDSRWDYI
ncbi:ribonuclease H-like protein [Lophium mytilinum]|uniref:ribonuclease H n=1 Tax=Lophium mytilinum TaxID=390894 RepID=A0A6A6QIT2_9PEZI|nr:ribonuclease H-like protein [Lophium mytilinum]